MTGPNSKPRVLLVYPCEIHSDVVAGTLRVAPIGLFLINGALRARGWQTRILDVSPQALAGDQGSAARQALRRQVAEFDPQVVGMSCRNLFSLDVCPSNPRRLLSYLSMAGEKLVVEQIRKATDAKIVAGGSAFSLAPKLYFEYLGLDYGIVGEGEIAFAELVLRLANKQGSVKDVAGLVYRQGTGGILQNEPQMIQDLVGMPAMDVGDLDDYRERYYQGGGYANIQTKRGCAYECIYCQYPFLEGRRSRLRNVATVVDEIEHLKRRFDVRHFFFVDSVFSTPPAHSVAICNEIIRRGLSIEWAAYVNPCNLAADVLDTYRRSGCHNLVLTPDALTDQGLQAYHKGFSMKQVGDSLTKLRQADLPFEVSVILGGPGDTPETVQQTVEFCDQYLKDVPVLFFRGVWMHPSAPIFALARQRGLLGRDVPEDFDSVVLANDFAVNKQLTYYFPEIVDNRREVLAQMLGKIRRHKRIAVGLDQSVDLATGGVSHSPELGVIAHERPWHRGMTGRMGGKP